jgi:hypothetical protein
MGEGDLGKHLMSMLLIMTESEGYW